MNNKLLVLGLSSLLAFGSTGSSFALEKSPTTAQEQPAAASDLIGRWNITVDNNGTAEPNWLEVKLSGTRTLVGYFVAAHGSARPVSEIKFDNGKFSFSIPPQWESGNGYHTVEGELTANGIKGTQTMPDGTTLSWTGVKAPYLVRESKPKWGKKIKLFNGKDLRGWEATGENQWVVKDGTLTNPKAGANLISTEKFEDFKLKVKFRIPEGSNAGIYLRGRYEVQIEDSPKDAHPSNVLYGGVYGFLTPSEIANLGPGEWQTYEITLVGRMVTIVTNGKTVISNQEIPGTTGGALDSNEGEPGPIYLQGDHGPVEFAEITITPAK